MFLRKSNHLLHIALGLCAVVFASQAIAAEETPREVMEKACKAFEGKQTAQARVAVSLDYFLADDLKVQKNFVVDMAAKMPNKFKAVRQGDETGSIYFDGHKLTAIDSVTGFFAQGKLEGNLNDLLDFADKMDVPTTLLDFIRPESCRESLEKISSMESLGTFTLNDVLVEHLLFRNDADEIHWEAWITKRADRYAIKKVVITSAYIKQQPQYSFVILSEKVDEPIAESEFDFIAPTNSSEIRFMDAIPGSTIEPNARWGGNRRVARRTARRTTRRVAYRNYYHSLPSSGCYWASPYYSCGGVYYEPVIEGGNTVYVIVENRMSKME